MPRNAPTPPVTARGRVDAIFFAGPRFSAGRLLTDGGEAVPFAGRFFARQDEQLVLHGKWVVHPRYGHQLEVERVEHDLDLDTGGLAHYLATHPDFKGIGPVKARVIAERFGTDFDRALAEQPDEVAKAARLPLEAVLRVKEEWQRTRAVNGAITWLAAFGLTHHQVTSLVQKLGNDAPGLLEQDPYIVVREVPRFAFKKVDKIARRLGTPKDHPARLQAALQYCVAEALDRGDCWVEYEDLVARADLLLVLDTLDSREQAARALDRLIDEGKLTCTSLGGRFLVALPQMRAMEEHLAGVFRAAGAPNPHFPAGADLEPLVARIAPQLNPAQRRAVLTVLGNRISLISGGAGSGKTYSVAAIAAACAECGLEVVLAAPTGKAAKRLEEVVGYRASTIHRLLGFDGTSYALGPDDPIDADVVIVDEVSMVDVPLAWHLFRAIDLSSTAVVLVGDHNQLPPVGPGNILRDLVQTRAVPTVILDQVVRQAGVLKESCAAVLRGEVRRTSDPEPSGRRGWYLANQFTNLWDAQRFLLELFDSVLEQRLGFDLVRDVQVLTPTHKGPLGTQALNIELQRLVQRKCWGVDVPVPRPGRRPPILRHDKVIQTRNNYELGVMNGATGVVTHRGRDGSLTIDFDGAPVQIEIGSEDLRDIQLAYALTIHKVQGSEFPCVVVVMHKSHSFMHHRNLLYTGVTRARQTTIIVGDRWGVRACVSKRLADERKTFLSLLLGEAAPAGPG